MKIYEIGTGYTPIPARMGAATEIVVEELTRSLLSVGEEVEIIDIKAQQRLETDLPIQEVSVPSIFTKTDVSLGIMHKLKRVVYSLSLAKKLRKIIKESKDKIVLHFHNQYNLFFFLKLLPKKLRSKVTIAYTVHSYIWGTSWEEIKETVEKRYFQEIFCVQNADLVFVLNDITTDHFVKHLGVDKSKIKRIINGVNTKTYAPKDENETEKIKNELSLKGKKVIFQVGSVCERKNQFGSLKMLCDYLKEHRDIVFLYAGGIIDQEYQDSITSFADENGIKEQVIYAGELSPGKELAKYYAISDLSVFSSSLESFGLVVIEAISAGKTVVVADKLMFDLSTGFETYSTKEEFIEKVDDILSGVLKNDGRQEVIDKYDWDVVAKDHAVLFTKA